jgi:hypothetical protein
MDSDTIRNASDEALALLAEHYSREAACCGVSRFYLKVSTGERGRYTVDAVRAAQARKILAAVDAEVARRGRS